jgi:tripartite-type tricarboxylate transporter receptor subunit TctC
MKNKLGWSIAIAVGLILSQSPQALANDFYQGKTIRVIVGFAAGGGYDTYARAVARHMGKHIPAIPSSSSRT